MCIALGQLGVVLTGAPTNHRVAAWRGGLAGGHRVREATMARPTASYNFLHLAVRLYVFPLHLTCSLHDL